MSYANALFQWEEGERRIRSAPPSERLALERVRDLIVAELRRRLGGAFTTDELTELYYRDGTDWCADIARAAAPDFPAAWDDQVVGDGAFARYLRDASDFAGGRRIQV